VTSQGVVQRGRLLQVKGIDYSVGDLLGDTAEAEAFEGGEQLTIYLHPRNYHRVHSPADGSIVASRHLSGTLYPVHSGASRYLPGLFAQNERLVTMIEGSDTRVAVVMVAAMGCGHVRAAYDREVWRCAETRRYTPPKPIRRGEEIGTFAMGSTVVMLVGPGGTNLRRQEPGSLLRQGESLTGQSASTRGQAEESVG
jgi:phosphatidylserine decarboxylase